MENVLVNGFQGLNDDEMNLIDGGAWYDAVLTFAGGIATTIGTCALVSGSTGIATMGVASLAACGPVGWAVIGIVIKGS